jgi:hypothetical protein
MRKWMPLVFLAAGLCMACGRVWTNHVMTGPYHGQYQGEVRVIMEGQPAPPGFQEVALVQAQGSGTKADMANVIAALRGEAARVGCNYVIQVRVDQGAGQASSTGVCGVVR